MVLEKTVAVTSKNRKSRQETDCDIILDTEIDRLLDEKAAKSNLSVFNVKSILRQLIQNEMVQQVLEFKMKRGNTSDSEKPNNSALTNSSSGIDCNEDSIFCFEPKLTRAKTKELIQNKDQLQLPLWPISPAKLLQAKPPPTETQILITSHDLPEESEAEDDEYIPKEVDFLASDDDASRTSMSDFGSPGTPLMVSRCASSRKKRDALVPSNRLNDGESVFKTPSPSPKKLTRGFPRANAIGLRTRSKLPLNDTPLEVLEKQLIPPDITTDMYEWNESDNEDYLQFLKTFAFSATPDAGNDDEEADPEYNVMEDEEDDHDKEEHRVDRAVKVTKKELNELIAELFDGYELPNEETGELLASISRQTGTEPKSTKVLPELSPSKVGSPSSVALPVSESVETEVQVVSANAQTMTASENDTPIRTELPPAIAAPEPIPCRVTETLPMVGQPTTSIPDVVAPSQSEIPLFTNAMGQVLFHQLQKHIQLLATTYVICSVHENPQAVKAAQSAKSMLMEISSFAEMRGPGSHFLGKNLKSAVGILYTWPPRLTQIQTRSPIKKKILEKYRSSQCNLPDYVERVVELFTKSPTFMYPALLPHSLLVVTGQVSGVSSFTPSEDSLIVRGIEDLKERRLTFVEISTMLTETLLPARTPRQILNRIKNSRKTASKRLISNTLKDYFERHILPESPTDAYLPVEALPPIDQPRELLSQKWRKSIEWMKKSSQENSGKSGFLTYNVGWPNPKALQVKRKRVSKIEDATEEKYNGASSDPNCVSFQTVHYMSPRISPLPAPDRQVFRVTNDSGELKFYYSVPNIIFTETDTVDEQSHQDEPSPADVVDLEGNDDAVTTATSVTGDASESSGHPSSAAQNSQAPTQGVPPQDRNDDEDDDEDKERREKKRFRYDPGIDDQTEEITDEEHETASDGETAEGRQDEAEPETICLLSPDRKGSPELEKMQITKKPRTPATGSNKPRSHTSSATKGKARSVCTTTPPKYDLEAIPQEDSDVVGAFSEAFLISVQQRLKRKEPGLYATFLDLFSTAEANDMSDEELYLKAEELLKDYPDLINDFRGLQTAEVAFTTGGFVQYQETHAQIQFLELLEKWTVNCPQLKTKIIQKMKSLHDTSVTENKIVDLMQPLFSQIQNPVILDSFKALFPSIFRPQSRLSDTDYEEVDMDSEETNKRDTPGHSLGELELDTFETVKLPEEKQVIATNSCPCPCHGDPDNVHYHTRARHCNKCCLRDGKLFLHSARVMKPVSIEFSSPELARQVFSPPIIKTTRPSSSSPSTSTSGVSLKKLPPL